MKFIFKIVSWLVILLAILTFAGYILYARLPDIASERLSKLLKVPVEIGDITLSFSTIAVDNLEISNIPAKKLSKAFSAEKITVQAPLKNYTEKTILIDQIAVDNIYLGLEFDSASGTSGNWTVLMNNLSSSENESSNKETVVIIKELVLTNIQVEVYYDKEGGSIKRLPPIDRIVLTNINSQAGLPTDQILKSVLGQMLQSVFTKENLQNMLKGVLQSPQGALDSLISPFKGLFK